MTRLQRKAVYFTLEGLNSFASTYYFNYLFFLLRDEFHFGNQGNLTVSALHGLIYVFSAWQGGKLAQKYGYINALRLGFGGMGLMIALAGCLPFLAGKLIPLAGWTISMCFTWPSLEALVSENESEKNLPRMIGIYNVVWASTAAVAYFMGGAIFEHFGMTSLYAVPALIHVSQLFLLNWATQQPTREEPVLATVAPPHHVPEAVTLKQRVPPQIFLKMAWLANPFAYVGINSLLAVIPDLAHRLGLTTTQSGIFCSLWFFVRMGAFVLLWRWTGWHYRFRWLLAAFIGLIFSFVALLVSNHLWTLVAAQIVFGFATGLIYYSSLFYSMDVSEAKGAHGGLHEAALGLGIFAGPAIAASALQFAPGHPMAGVWADGVLLTAGLVGLIWMRWRGKK